MASGFNRAQFEQQLRNAQRQAEAQLRREVDRINRENQRRVDAYNRQVEQHNRRVIQDYNRQVDQHNRRVQAEQQRQVDAYNRHVDQVNRHNREAAQRNSAVIQELNRQLRAGGGGATYTPQERVLADRVNSAVAGLEAREYDVFLSYARIDGGGVAADLRDELLGLGVTVWFDEITITPGKSQALQMDRGLRASRAGVALLTPAYLAGRFWTERELGALLHKETLIPVLHNVTFAEVAEYSGILPDLAGFETARDSLETIAQKIAAAVVGEVAA